MTHVNDIQLEIKHRDVAIFVTAVISECQQRERTVFKLIKIDHLLFRPDTAVAFPTLEGTDSERKANK